MHRQGTQGFACEDLPRSHCAENCAGNLPELRPVFVLKAELPEIEDLRIEVPEN